MHAGFRAMVPGEIEQKIVHVFLLENVFEVLGIYE